MSERVDNRRRTAAIVSVALGETGAPYEDVCLRASCRHNTCTAVWALWDEGAFGPPDPTRVPHGVRCDECKRHRHRACDGCGCPCTL